jgi:hypothetical protein
MELSIDKAWCQTLKNEQNSNISSENHKNKSRITPYHNGSEVKFCHAQDTDDVYPIKSFKLTPEIYWYRNFSDKVFKLSPLTSYSSYKTKTKCKRITIPPLPHGNFYCDNHTFKLHFTQTFYRAGNFKRVCKQFKFSLLFADSKPMFFSI